MKSGKGDIKITRSFFFLIVMLLASCGNLKTEQQSAPAADSLAPLPNHTDSMVYTSPPDEVSALPETPPSKIEIPEKKSARLAYSYSPEMKRNESADINVYVSIVNPTSFVRDTLMKIIAQQKNPKTGMINTDSIVAANILLYKRLKIELIDPDSCFRIKKIYGETWQEVDSTGDNRWRWNLIPLTNLPEAKLVIKVVAETPSGVQKDIDDRTFFIKVKMTGPVQMIRSWGTYLQDNPGLVLTVILIPLIASFGKRYLDRKKKP